MVVTAPKVQMAEKSPSFFIPKASYISREFLEGEKRGLWPKVWLIACRVEELRRPGDFVTFDIADESILVVRDQDHTIRAFHNVCQHRGRRLMDVPRGSTSRFFCRYHGWRYKLDGTNDILVDKEDWGGTLDCSDVGLKKVRVDTWGGWVFINMSPEGESLAEYLGPLPHAFRNFNLDNMRYRWAKRVTLPCNWKVAMDVFIEGYHGNTAHRQVNFPGVVPRLIGERFGRHSVFRVGDSDLLSQFKAGTDHISDTDREAFPEDFARYSNARNLPKLMATYFETMNRDLDCWVTTRLVSAAKRVADEIDPKASYLELMIAIDQAHREEGAKEGISWGQLPREEIEFLGVDWNVFPNIALLPMIDGLLVYRALPNGDDPDSCILDIWAIEPFAPGKEPEFKPEVYADWQDTKWPRIFEQDFRNLAAIQAGIKSMGFSVGLANPMSELTVANFHHYVWQYAQGVEKR